MEAYFAWLPVEAALETYNVCLFDKNKIFQKESIKIKEIAINPEPCAV
jgi:hypothetical protein